LKVPVESHFVCPKYISHSFIFAFNIAVFTIFMWFMCSLELLKQTNVCSLKSLFIIVCLEVHSCGSIEAVIRLVLSAVVGVATVILLVYDIRSTRGGD